MFLKNITKDSCDFAINGLRWGVSFFNRYWTIATLKKHFATNYNLNMVRVTEL